MVMLDRFEKLFCSACLFCVTVTPQALFAETASWHYKVTPYLWNVGFEGNTSSGGNDIPIDTDYSFFTLDNLDKVFSIAFEASNGRLGILFDGLRASYSDNTSNVLFATQLSLAARDTSLWIRSLFLHQGRHQKQLMTGWIHCLVCAIRTAWLETGIISFVAISVVSAYRLSW
jgi:hypothetical protein